MLIGTTSATGRVSRPSTTRAPPKNWTTPMKVDPRLSWLEPDLLEQLPLSGGLGAEPAEQLLHAVGDQERAHGDAQQRIGDASRASRRAA
jgi:hypothetical protein